MHELSIAQNLFKLVDRKRPHRHRVTVVRLKVGPLQAVDPSAMEWAWRSITIGTKCAESHLEIEPLPWKLYCPDCDQTWESADLYESCRCGCQDATPQAGDELQLDAIEVGELALETA